MNITSHHTVSRRTVSLTTDLVGISEMKTRGVARMTQYSCAGWCAGDRHDTPPMLVATFNVDAFRDTQEGDRLEDAGLHPADSVTLCPSCVQRLLLQTPGVDPTP